MLRPLKLPGDFGVGVDLIFRGFQDAPADKQEVAIDGLKSLQSIWPLVQVGRWISPSLRDIFEGFIWEEDSRPVGLVTFDREGFVDRWEIGIIVVLPEYRRRGIARKLMIAALDSIRERGGKVAVLDAAAESAAACILYEQLGFEQLYTANEFNCTNDLQSHYSVPDGYQLAPLKSSDWRTRFDLELRAVPAQITRFEPPEEARFRTPWIIQTFQSLFYILSGQRTGQFAIRSPEGQTAGWGSYLARKRPGGVNYIRMRMDPKHEQVARFLESYLIKQVQEISPGRRIMFSIPDWQSPLIDASLALGSSERTRYHRMGMFL